MRLLSFTCASSNVARPLIAFTALLPILLAGCGSGGTPTVFTPTISPAPGSYTQPVTVTLAAETPGASIYYTESTTNASTLYTGPFQVSSSETIQVVGAAKGYNNSTPVLASYVILRPAAAPVISPPSGSYAGPLTVTITDSTPRATIYYTTDGSTPTVSANLYSGPFTITASATVKAVAIATLFTLSPTAEADYTITPKHLTWACLSGCGQPAPGPCSGVLGGRGGALQSMGWTDLKGNLWFFGGETTPDASDFLGQVWVFNLTTDQWTQISAGPPLDTPGVYGTLGTAAATNTPGARKAGYTWTDAAGNFWLFGGYGYDANSTIGLLNDLWTYNPSTKLWTWMGGSQTVNATGVYGTQGTAASTNVPGARQEGSTWKDAAGNFWLFGASGIDSNGKKGLLNDLWEFSATTNQWTWVGGSNIVGVAPNYGTIGAPAPTNQPGGYLDGSVSATDAAGEFLIYGGVAATSNAPEDVINTVWKFNPAMNQWTWVSGSNIGTVTGSYGMLGVPAATNVPGSHQSGIAWADATGNLYTFGGFGVDSTGAPGYLNDLWKFDPVAAQWTWVAGSNTIDAVPVYGTPGLASVSNVGGARAYAVSWTGTDGSFYFFAGYGIDALGLTGDLGDLWQFTP